MTKTKYYDLQMDDPQDDYDVEVVNANLKKIDEQMKTRENATDALQEPEFTVADKRENIASKEKMPKILGKIAKFFTDLKTVAFSGKYSDLDGKPAIVNNNTATEAGSALDARQANPTIEGTMANQISQLNSDLSGLNDSIKNSSEIKLDNGIYFGYSGHIGSLRFSSASISNGQKIQLPDGIADILGTGLAIAKGSNNIYVISVGDTNIQIRDNNWNTVQSIENIRGGLVVNVVY